MSDLKSPTTVTTSSEPVEQITTTTTVGSTPELVTQPDDQRFRLATRVLWYMDGVLLVLLGFRFVFALLGVNTLNAFASFIYTVTYPFVAPFFSLFGYHVTYGTSSLEVFTLVAMAVYVLVAWGLDRLINIGRA